MAIRWGSHSYGIVDAAADKYLVTLVANPENGGTLTGEGYYLPEVTASVSAIPNENHEFVNWTKEGEIISTTPSFTFTVTENVTLTANFKPLGISEIAPAAFNIYPNPATDKIKIVRLTNEKAQIEIYNMFGAKLKTFELSELETEINISGFSSGVYLIRLIDNRTLLLQSYCFIKH